MQSETEKVTKSLIHGLSRHDWNPELFAGMILNASPGVQRMMIESAITLLKAVKRNYSNDHLRYRVDDIGGKMAEAVDLTQFDQ